MNQNFDFSNSKHSLDNKSKVIDNQGANIENQNFHIHLAMNKKAFTIFVFIITTFLTFSKKSKNQILHSTNPFVKGF